MSRQIILVPALISLAVTIFQLAGEPAHWLQKYFNTGVGGGGSTVGITCLRACGLPRPAMGAMRGANARAGG
jgi:hypothetical protein